jgi:hypothetical protein
MARETTLRQVMAAAAGMAPVVGLTAPPFSWAAVTRQRHGPSSSGARQRGQSPSKIWARKAAIVHPYRLSYLTSLLQVVP